MAYSCRLNAERIVEVKTSHVVGLQDCLAWLDEVATHLAAEDCYKVLTDHTNLERMNLSGEDLRIFMKQLGAITKRRRLVQAVVTSEPFLIGLSKQSALLYEVQSELGGPIDQKFFDSEGEALTWLRSIT